MENDHLTCYKDVESEIAPCVIPDDVRGMLEKIRDADGVQEAFDLRVSIAKAVKGGKVRPYDPARIMAAFSNGDGPTASE